MKTALIFTASAIFILVFTLELAHIAEGTANKALEFSSGINSAVDCAFRGIDLETCSPELFNYGFEPDTENTITALSVISSGYSQINSSEIIVEMDQILQNDTLTSEEKEEKLLEYLDLIG
ncbi:hypothetical protein GF327_03535 [Candidatus Woesearchaeota archaeon]|nr:hypothetical protein [Candidatus Woesearchaeota archaeon]